MNCVNNVHADRLPLIYFGGEYLLFCGEYLGSFRYVFVLRKPLLVSRISVFWVLWIAFWILCRYLAIAPSATPWNSLFSRNMQYACSSYFVRFFHVASSLFSQMSEKCGRRESFGAGNNYVFSKMWCSTPDSNTTGVVNCKLFRTFCFLRLVALFRTKALSYKLHLQFYFTDSPRAKPKRSRAISHEWCRKRKAIWNQ